MYTTNDGRNPKQVVLSVVFTPGGTSCTSRYPSLPHNHNQVGPRTVGTARFR